MARARDLKEENRRTVRKIFFSRETVSAGELMENAFLSHGAAVNVLREMEENGEILLREKTGTSKGRKTHRYSLDPSYRTIAALSIFHAGDEILYTLRFMDLKGNTLRTETKTTPAVDFGAVVPFLSEHFEKLPDILLISSPGIWKDDTVTLNGTVYDLGSELQSRWSFPCLTENDVNTAAVGYRQISPGENDVAFLYQADKTVFGCGILIGGRLHRGSSGASGELRYLPFMRYTEERTAAGLLKEQIIGTAAILNPEVIVWCSQAVDEEIRIEPEFLPESMCPRLVRTDDMQEMIFRGLYAMAVDCFINTAEAEKI